MFLDEKAEGEPPPKKLEWPTWYKHHYQPVVYSYAGKFYVVLPQND